MACLASEGIRKKQAGAALIVALVILVMVSLLGVSAMRSSIFSSKVVTGVQADALSFEAAETAIAIAFRGLSSLNDIELTAALDSGGVEACVSGTGSMTAGECDSTAFMDSRGLLRAQAYSYLSGYQPIAGSQVSVTGSGGVFVDYRVDILGQSDFPTLKLDNNHLQETLKRGIKPGSDIK